MIAKPDLIHGDVDKIFAWHREQKLLASQRQEAARNSAEVTLLDGAESQVEYKKDRQAVAGLVSDATSPLGEVSYRDYKIRREHIDPDPGPAFTDGMSFQEYKKWRDRSGR